MTIDKDNLREAELSQVPAIHLLWNMGWNYITDEEALIERGNRHQSVILEKILRSKLKEINKDIPFSESDYDNAVYALKNISYEGLITTSEKIYELITLGKSFEIRAKESYDMKYIDWENPSNNLFHVTDEFSVEKKDGSGNKRRPDLVCFVNGIPVSVIECKDDSIHLPIDEAVRQNIRNSVAEEIPHLMAFAQITMGVAPLRVLTNEDFQKHSDHQQCQYATTGTPKDFWFPWRERDLDETNLDDLVNKPLTVERASKLFDGTRYQHVKEHYTELIDGRRQVTQQDQILYSLMRPERLFEIIQDYILFDGGHKKIARFNQFYSVKSAIRRITDVDDSDLVRPSGLIWHTQGAGKSLTMVLLAKAIARQKCIPKRKIIIMTDRKRLDKQIAGTFRNCGIPVERASSGRRLVELLKSNRAAVIATTLYKFTTVLNEGETFDSRDIFIPIDEAHRSQFGESRRKVEKVFPNACYIGYTGTPIAKKGVKNTFAQFNNELFDLPYTVNDALRDKAVVPLRFEGRMVDLDVNNKILDKFFEDMTSPLSTDQRAHLKKEYARMDMISKTDPRISMIALDIKQHAQDWLDTGLKGLLAVDSIESAFKYHDAFKSLGGIKTSVIISKRDDKDRDSIEMESTSQWYRTMIKERFNGSFETYEDHEVDLYKDNEDDSADILIVVYKLLTGFDAPRCSNLYIDKPFNESHSLLQAFARVNRRFAGKDFGVIIDYRGNVSNLKKAINEYDNLELTLKGEKQDIDLKKEVVETTMNVEEEIDKLDDYLEELDSLFKNIDNKNDVQEYDKLLMDKKTRDDFYERLRKFSSCLQLALSSRSFYQNTSTDEVNEYKKTLANYIKLRVRASRQNAETIDFKKDYSPKIAKLFNQHVTADEIETVVPEFDIYSPDFSIEAKKDPKNTALMKANKFKKHLEAKLKIDEFFYKPISEQIEKALKDYREGRIDEAKLLEKTLTECDRVKDRDTGKGIPSSIKENSNAQALFGIIVGAFKKDNHEVDLDKAANLSLKIDEVLQRDVSKVDWSSNKEIIKKINNEVEDLMLSFANEISREISFETIDFVLEYVIKTAKNRFS